MINQTISYIFERKLTQRSGDYKVFEYTLKWSDGRKGDCAVFIDLVRKCSFQFTDAQMKRFRLLGIKKDDLCICLDDFHPHGRRLDPDKCNFMQKGLGEEILKKIIKSLEDIDAKFIYTYSSTRFMKNFIKKQGWKPCNRRENIWFLQLKNQ